VNSKIFFFIFLTSISLVTAFDFYINDTTFTLNATDTNASILFDVDAYIDAFQVESDYVSVYNLSFDNTTVTQSLVNSTTNNTVILISSYQTTTTTLLMDTNDCEETLELITYPMKYLGIIIAAFVLIAIISYYTLFQEDGVSVDTLTQGSGWIVGLVVFVGIAILFTIYIIAIAVKFSNTAC